MEPKEPPPTCPTRPPTITTEDKEQPPTEHKQEPPTEQKQDPPTEHKEEPLIRRRGRPRLSIQQKEENKRIRLANLPPEEQEQQRSRHATSQRERHVIEFQKRGLPHAHIHLIPNTLAH